MSRVTGQYKVYEPEIRKKPMGFLRIFYEKPREIYNSKIFSHETFFKMFFKQFKSIRIFLFRCYMKDVIVMNFFRFAA